MRIISGVQTARARAGHRTVTMDFKGQQLSERVYQVCIVLFACVGFVLGYCAGSFRTMMVTYGAGVSIAIFVAVPDWVYFNQHPQRWLRADKREGHKAGKQAKWR